MDVDNSAENTKFARAGRTARLATNLIRAVKIAKVCQTIELKRNLPDHKLNQELQLREENEVNSQLKKVVKENQGENVINIVGNTWNIFQAKEVPNINPHALRRVRKKERISKYKIKRWFDFDNTIDNQNLDSDFDGLEAKELNFNDKKIENNENFKLEAK